MTPEELKLQIDTDITNKTSARSITPLNVGKNMKDVINLIPDITNKVDKITNKSLVSDTEIAKLVNLDNTKDIDKPVSTAQQTALDLKANASALASKADLAGPTFTGTVSGITKSMVGLANVDNTADSAKPVSTAQQAAIDAAVQANLVDSTLINGVTTSSAIPPTGNIHAIGVGAGTYTNWGGMVVPANNIGTLSRVGGVYAVSLTAFTDINKILPWVAQSYLINSQVNYSGIDWISNAATVAGDIPGTSAKWVNRLGGYADIKFINPDTVFTADELAVINAIKSVKIYNANTARKYVIRFLCNNDVTYKYNICIADKITGQEQTINIPTVTTVNGIVYLSLNVTLGTDDPVNIKLAINYSGLANRVYINAVYTACNLVLLQQTYVDVSPTEISTLNAEVVDLNNSINSILTSSNEVYIKQPPTTWSLKYWTATGTLSTYLDYCHTNYLKVMPNATVTISGVVGVGTGASAKTMSFFDINFNFICYFELYSTVVDSSLSVNFEDIAYVSFCHNNINNTSGIVININNNTEFEKIDKRVTVLEGQSLSGKTLAVMGDSIMMLMRTVSFGDTQNWDSLKTKLGLTNLYNLGLGGATWQDKGDVNNTDTPLPDTASSYISNEIRWLKRLITGGSVSPHLIVVAAGTNSFAVTGDYTAIMAMSFSALEASYTDRSTLYGGLRYNLETLTKDFPTANIIVFSPIQSAGTAGRTYDALKLTSEAIKKMAGRYSCVFINSLDELGVIQNYEVDGGSGRYLTDGLHFNTAGKLLCTNFYAKKIEQNYISRT